MEDKSCSLNLKRQRDETMQTSQVVVEEKEEVMKRQKSYKDIISLLEDHDEDEPTHDLSLLISTLEQEISDSLSDCPSASSSAQSHPDGSGSDEEEKENVMKHLLQASDDELGLPNTGSVMDVFDDDLVGGQLDGGDPLLPLGGEGLWEFEDHEATNYYSFLQSSQIFL